MPKHLAGIVDRTYFLGEFGLESVAQVMDAQLAWPAAALAVSLGIDTPSGVHSRSVSG